LRGGHFADGVREIGGREALVTKKIAGRRAAGMRDYERFASDIRRLLEDARSRAARSVNAILTATYWEIGRRIVEREQKGAERAAYGEALLERLSLDLSRRFGRGFSHRNLDLMRQFYLAHPPKRISRTLSAKSGPAPRPLTIADISRALPLSWSHYARLLQVADPLAGEFYEAEALRGGWSVRQLDRQIGSQFYERTALSNNKAAMLAKGGLTKPADRVAVEEQIKNPYVLEFLGLKDEYSESDLEEALIRHLESFLLELGGDFTFVARQKRLRVGNAWYRVDLVFYHRRLRCLVLVDLKLDRFTHADAGQMHLYLNYAREHWTHLDENPPVGLILCSEKDEAVAHYALEGLPNKVMAAEYKTALPNEKKLVEELRRTKLALDARNALGRPDGKGA
jgi:predicted nuclease of restriction endonuclease-like (RecB) superfamily